MPMNKNSTLIYFVNKFQADFSSTIFKEDEESVERFLTEMDDEIITPSESTITNILNFARSYEVLETEETGCVELILN